CYSVPKLEAPVVDTPALTGAPFTFGSYNNLDKVNEHTIETWAKVVLAVPGSRLLLRSSIANPTIYQRTMDGLKKFGLPEDRFTIDSVTKTYAEHMISYGQLDLALDPFPYNGGTTTV